MINNILKAIFLILIFSSPSACASKAGLKSIAKASKSCPNHTYEKAHSGRAGTVVYEYASVDKNFAKELGCLTGYTLQALPGSKSTVAFHIKSVKTFMLFFFDFERDMYTLQTFSNVPQLTEGEGYMMESYLYVGARVAVGYLQGQRPIPNSPITGMRGIVPFDRAESYFEYLKTGKESSEE